MARVPNGVKTLPKISTGSVGCTNVTDRQTNGRSIAYSESSRSLKAILVIKEMCFGTVGCTERSQQERISLITNSIIIIDLGILNILAIKDG